MHSVALSDPLAGVCCWQGCWGGVSSTQRSRGGEGVVEAQLWELGPRKRGFRDTPGRWWTMSLPWELCKRAGAGCWGAVLCLGGVPPSQAPRQAPKGPCPAPPQLSLSELAEQPGSGGLHQGPGLHPHALLLLAGKWELWGGLQLMEQAVNIAGAVCPQPAPTCSPTQPPAVAVPAPLCTPRSSPRLDARCRACALTARLCRDLALGRALGLQVWGHSSLSGQNPPCGKVRGSLGRRTPSPAWQAGGWLRCSPRQDGGAAGSLLSRRSPLCFYQRCHPIFPGCFVFALHLSILPADPPVPLRGFINIAL